MDIFLTTFSPEEGIASQFEVKNIFKSGFAEFKWLKCICFLQTCIFFVYFWIIVWIIYGLKFLILGWTIPF